MDCKNTLFIHNSNYLIAMEVSAALVILLKNPIKGKAKTRLANDIGLDNAHEVYLSLIDYTAKVTESYLGPKSVYYAFFIDENDQFEALEKRLQSGQDLGERIQNALSEVLQVHERVMFIGSDCATLTTDILHNASQMLDEQDVVIGPSHDGGYYLIGVKGHQQILFQDVKWSTDQVYTQTLEKAKESNLKVGVLPMLSDIDDLESLRVHGKNLGFNF